MLHSPASAVRFSGRAKFTGWLWLFQVACLVPGGFADEAADIHTLVEAAREGDEIELPTGRFELNRPLVIDKRISLAGQGSEETILRSAAEEPGVMLRIQNADGVRLSGFALDGAENDRVSQGIVISDASNLRLDSLRIRDIPGNGDFGPHAIYASTNVTDSHFTAIRIRNIGRESEWGAGIRIGEGGGGNLIENNDLAGFGRGGILTTHGSTDTIIRNNRVRDFGHSGPGLGIEVWGSGERVVIEDNVVDHWISVDGQEAVAVRRNEITGAEDPDRIGSYGLELVNSIRVVMTDNVMRRGNHIGLSVSNSARKDLAYWARNRLHNSETWGAQIQGEEGGAHRMYFSRNTFSDTRRSERALYPGAAGHGFRFNGNAFQMVLHANRIEGNAGAGIQLGGDNLDRLSFFDNRIAGNRGPAVTGGFDGNSIAWEGNEISGNDGGDSVPESKDFHEADIPVLSIRIEGEPRAGERLAFDLAGYSDDRFSEVLWDPDHGIPRTGATVEQVYDHAGDFRITAVAWTHAGRGVLVEKEIAIEE